MQRLAHASGSGGILRLPSNSPDRRERSLLGHLQKARCVPGPEIRWRGQNPLRLGAGRADQQSCGLQGLPGLEHSQRIGALLQNRERGDQMDFPATGELARVDDVANLKAAV
jgi:hypothetical protein